MPGCSASLGFGAGVVGFLGDGAAAPCELWFLRGRHFCISAKEPGYNTQGRPQRLKLKGNVSCVSRGGISALQSSCLDKETKIHFNF